MAKAHRKGLGDKPKTKKTERMCLVTREVKEPDDLIRFVLDPENNVVPDLKAVLPGRGVWISANKQDVKTAVLSGAFSRGFQRQAKADADLPDTIETLLVNATVQALSLVAKAGLVTTGFEKVAASLGSKGLKALLFAEDGSNDGIGKIRGKLQKADASAHIAVHQSLRSEQMALALGRSHVIHAALREGGATEMCLKHLVRLERFRIGEQPNNQDKTRT